MRRSRKQNKPQGWKKPKLSNKDIEAIHSLTIFLEHRLYHDPSFAKKYSWWVETFLEDAHKRLLSVMLKCGVHPMGKGRLVLTSSYVEKEDGTREHKYNEELSSWYRDLLVKKGGD